MRTFGKIWYSEKSNGWLINKAEPHVCIKLKAIFTKIPKGNPQPFKFDDRPETCTELLWFMGRYPLEISESDLNRLMDRRNEHYSFVNELEAINLPDYKPRQIILKEGKKGRGYQLQGNEIAMKCKRILNGDDIGLGKTISGILQMMSEGTLPCMVVVQTHSTFQWKEKIEEFTNLRVHIIKGTKPYNLPEGEVYITTYSRLAGWVDVYRTNFFKSVVFDEIQELRHDGTAKYSSACELSVNAEYVQGLTNTPMYNYAIEIFNVLNVIKKDCLGDRYDFLREWMGGYGRRTVEDPNALGAYLRENFLMLRRTRKEVGRELPPINTIVHTVPYDEKEVQKSEDIARQLAIKVTSGSFEQRGQASRELDMLIRHNTGVSKAKGVAEYVRILLENEEPIILAAWHRDVYDILLKELAEYNPVMYTGSESPAQKEKSKQAFINGETNLFIISLRSGVGLDGLQERCSMVVIAELDWSPMVHKQLIGRSDRERKDGTLKQTTVIYLVSDCGSDPLIVDLLGLKSSQSEAIMNPLESGVQEKYSDESRIKLLAQKYLDKKDKSKDN